MNQVRVGAAGGIEAIVKAINAHIDNAELCKNGCSTLWDMIKNNGKNNEQIKYREQTTMK